MDRIRRATTADYEAMTRLGQYCFPHDAGALDWRWNHVWAAHLRQPSSSVTDRFLLWKEEGRVLGMLALVPMTLVWGEVRLPVAGVSSVATHPEHRSRGIMSALLERACRDMSEAGTLLSDLGGDRFRYGNYGWEPAGLRANLRFADKYLRALPEPEARPIHVTAHDERAAAALLELSSRRNPRYERGAGELEALLHRRATEFWVVPEGDGLGCYLAAFDDTVVEYAGRARFLPGLIKHFARMHGLTEVTVHAPARFAEAEEILYRLCGDFALGPLHCFRIVRFVELMRSLAPVLCARMAEVPGAAQLPPLSLTLRETGEGVTLRPHHREVGVDTGVASGDALTLSRRDMTRLLLGPFAEGLLAPLSPAARGWGALLPLPFHCSWLDTV